jgi:hypothetical protein
MEKISALIDKLQELKTTGATLQSISYYVQLLQAEILHARSLEREREREMQRRQSNIAVIMPGTTPATEPAGPASFNDNTTAPQVTASQPKPAPEYQPVFTEPEPPATQPVQEVTPEPVDPQPVQEVIPEPVAPQPVVPTPVAFVEPPAPIAPAPVEPTPAPAPLELKAMPLELRFEPLPEIKPEPVEYTAPPVPVEETKEPAFVTLFGNIEQPVASTTKAETNSITKELKELNQKVAQNIPSLNDRLRQQQSEIGDRFSDLPVKDLRQAIGINDKFQFIQELFRGDVDSYERSLKTINEMHSLQDAEYWIERELKIRQGWEDDNRVVRQFYALVKKRFS